MLTVPVRLQHQRCLFQWPKTFGLSGSDLQAEYLILPVSLEGSILRRSAVLRRARRALRLLVSFSAGPRGRVGPLLVGSGRRIHRKRKADLRTRRVASLAAGRVEAKRHLVPFGKYELVRARVRVPESKRNYFLGLCIICNYPFSN